MVKWLIKEDRSPGITIPLKMLAGFLDSIGQFVHRIVIPAPVLGRYHIEDVLLFRPVIAFTPVKI
jgi:hypothetical protein